MNLADLNKVALAMVTPGKGLLAADESSGTIKKRFDDINVVSTEETRRDYREMLFRSSEAMSRYISGVILYDETIWQNAADGTPLVKIIEQTGAIPGIKVINMAGCPHNPANTAAVLVHYLTFGDLPALDQYNRPLFAYGRVIHDQCERRAHYDAGRFVTGEARYLQVSDHRALRADSVQECAVRD